MNTNQNLPQGGNYKDLITYQKSECFYWMVL